MAVKTMLKALGEPVRYEMFSKLLERKRCVRSLSRQMGISEPAVSQHLKVMREAGLIRGEKYGHHTHYMPRQEAVDFLAEEFQKFGKQVAAADSDDRVCHCISREESTE